jgi:hypothetical protein
MTTMTTLERGYDQLPIPFGWFAVALSNEIQNGEIVHDEIFRHRIRAVARR